MGEAIINANSMAEDKLQMKRSGEMQINSYWTICSVMVFLERGVLDTLIQLNRGRALKIIGVITRSTHILLFRSVLNAENHKFQSRSIKPYKCQN